MIMAQNVQNLEKRMRDFDISYAETKENIARAAEVSGRKYEDIKLLAATKTVPVELINYAAEKGIDLMGENRVQELDEKYDRLSFKKDQIHFIGTLQTNKVHNLIGRVGMIESVNSERLAGYISRISLERNTVTDVLVEVNVGAEATKSGADMQSVIGLMEKISGFSGIRVRGLMAIPPATDDQYELKMNFSNMYNMFIDIRDKKIDNISMDFLSMGMSHDYREAIECGANIVRIGSALFGARSYARD